MADLGMMALMLGLALSAYSVIGSIIGEKTGLAELAVSARRALYMTMLAAAFAIAISISLRGMNRIKNAPSCWCGSGMLKLTSISSGSSMV